MMHPFLSDIDFKKLIKKEIVPEWKPILRGEDDVGNFDEEFTNMGIFLKKKLITVLYLIIKKKIKTNYKIIYFQILVITNHFEIFLTLF